MKEQILNVLSEHPNGLRLREIGSYLNVWHIKLMAPIHELKEAGLVTAETYRDAAQMEMYDIWKIKKEG